jgi:sugar phosphate isomerase/epimerase
MKRTDDKLDILQNLEFSVVEIWRAHPEMSDYTALRAYEAAFQTYRAELRGHAPKPPGLSGLDAEAFEAVKAMCEFRLARKPCPVPGPENVPPIALPLLVDCLRELGKSVERHTKADGRQGYLTFIDRFLP